MGGGAQDRARDVEEREGEPRPDWKGEFEKEQHDKQRRNGGRKRGAGGRRKQTYMSRCCPGAVYLAD